MDRRCDRGENLDRTVPSLAVVEAVADAEGVPPERLCPPAYESLYSVIDPNGLDALFAPRADGTPRSTGTVSFPFCGYRVVVDDQGSVTLENSHDDR